MGPEGSGPRDGKLISEESLGGRDDGLERGEQSGDGILTLFGARI